MNQAQEIDRVRQFINRYADFGFYSTGAKLVAFSDDLYNVHNSTDDPKEVPDHEGLAWKNLLIRLCDLADANCYVTNAIPDEGSSHPSFAVGGHMTPDSTGTVPIGGVSYLMPLCKWHNSTSRDGVAFEHTETKMLQLTGFMEGDLAVTFAMRLPSAEKHSLLYFDRGKGHWDFKDLCNEKALTVAKQPLSGLLELGEPAEEYALFEQRGDRYFVVDTNL